MSYFYISDERPVSNTDPPEWLLVDYKQMVYKHTVGIFMQVHVLPYDL